MESHLGVRSSGTAWWLVPEQCVLHKLVLSLFCAREGANGHAGCSCKHRGPGHCAVALNIACPCHEEMEGRCWTGWSASSPASLGGRLLPDLSLPGSGASIRLSSVFPCDQLGTAPPSSPPCSSSGICRSPSAKKILSSSLCKVCFRASALLGFTSSASAMALQRVTQPFLFSPG